jgi:hypothetical protein
LRELRQSETGFFCIVDDRHHGTQAGGAAGAPTEGQAASESAEPAGGTPAQFSEYLKQQIDKYAKLVKTLGLEPE